MEENIDIAQRRRRRHSAEFKAQVVKASMQPGISIAAVALHYRLNAHLLRRWVGSSWG
jgi:transposase